MDLSKYNGTVYDTYHASGTTFVYTGPVTQIYSSTIVKQPDQVEIAPLSFEVTLELLAIIFLGHLLAIFIKRLLGWK